MYNTMVYLCFKAPVALQRVESPAIQYTAAKLSTVSESDACSAPQKRRLVPGTNIPFPPVPESIRKQQEKFLVKATNT